MRKTLFFIYLFFLILHIPAQAALYVDGTCTTDKRHFDAEFSYDYYRDAQNYYDLETGEYIQDASKEQYATFYLSYGILDNWDVGLTVPYVFLETNSTDKVTDGLSDVVIETKYRLWEEKNILPSYALYFDVKVPSANKDRGLSSGEYDFTINNIFTKNIGKNTFDFNLGYVFIGEKGISDIFYYVFDVTRYLTEKLYLCAELYGDTMFKNKFDDNTFCAAISFGCDFNKLINLESGVGFGISKASPDYQLSTTLTFTF